MKTVVVDASALVKRVLAEPDSHRVRGWFDRNADARLVGPWLLFSETGRILQKNQRGASFGHQRSVHSRLVAGIQFVAPDETIWEDATDLTFYDAHYVHLATQLGAPLATTDQQMAAAAERRGIPIVEFDE